MGKALIEIAEQLRASNKKVQLIYAFNGTGKTLLSREFKRLITLDVESDALDEIEQESRKILYYNAFTEDLFHWDNDLEFDSDPKLKILPNSFTDWVLQEEGQDQNAITYFHHFASKKLTPRFNEDFSEITFTIERGNDETIEKVKISKGEESSFIWSIFYTLLVQVIDILNISEPEERETSQFDTLEYVFIDDPVSSLDENHLIELAVNLAQLIRSSNSQKLKFIITTHNPLFYNVLYNEVKAKSGNILRRHENGTYGFEEKKGDSNKSFSYHLHLKHLIEQAIEGNQIQKYHFTLLRNLYEKTANFLGYPRWSELLPDDKLTYYNRIIQFTSHSTLSNEVVAEPTQAEKQIVKFLLNNLVSNFKFWEQVGQSD